MRRFSFSTLVDLITRGSSHSRERPTSLSMPPPTSDRDKDKSRDAAPSPTSTLPSSKPSQRFPNFGFNRIFPKRQASTSLLRGDSLTTTPPSATSLTSPQQALPTGQILAGSLQGSPLTLNESSPQPEPLSLESIFNLLSGPSFSQLPPAILTSHIRTATSLLQSTVPCPSTDVITSVLLRACAGSCPTEVRCAGFDLLSGYLAASQSNSTVELSSIEKSTLWMIIKSGRPSTVDPSRLYWLEWYPRLRSLFALTDGGKYIDGMQGIIPCLAEMAEGAAWARVRESFARPGVGSNSASSSDGPSSATHCVLHTLSYLTGLIKFNSPPLLRADISAMIDVFDACTNISLCASFGLLVPQVVTDFQGQKKEPPQLLRRSSSPAPSTPMASLPVAMSASSDASVSTYSSSAPTVLHILPSHLYMTFITQLLASTVIPSTHLDRIIRTLTLITTRSLEALPSMGILKSMTPDGGTTLFSIRPSPDASGSNTPIPSTNTDPHPSTPLNSHPLALGFPPEPVLDTAGFLSSQAVPDPRNAQLESMAWELMRVLLSGPYSITVGRIVKKLAWADKPDTLSGNVIVGLLRSSTSHGLAVRRSDHEIEMYTSALYAEGSIRTMRLALRRAAEGRLSRNWLSNQVSGSYGMTGAPTFSASMGTKAGVTPGAVNKSSSTADLPGLPRLEVSNGFLPPASQPSDRRLKSIEDEVMERAWGREGEGGAWEVERVMTVLPGAMGVWVDRLQGSSFTRSSREVSSLSTIELAKERVIREGLGIISDVMEETILLGPDATTNNGIGSLGVSGGFGAVPVSNMSTLGMLESALIGAVIGVSVKAIPLYASPEAFQPYILDLSSTSSANGISAPSPLLHSLTRILHRIPFLAPITPPLPTILLTISNHLSDETCADIIRWHQNEGLLNPSAPAWLDSIGQMFALVGITNASRGQLGSVPAPISPPQPPRGRGTTRVVRHLSSAPERILSRKTLAEAVTTVYRGVRDYRPFRLQLLNLCLSVWETRYAQPIPFELENGSVLQSAWNILADGIVAGAAEEVPLGAEAKSPRRTGSDESGYDGASRGRETPVPIAEEGSGLERRIRVLVSRVARETPCPFESSSQYVPALHTGQSTSLPSGTPSATNSPYRNHIPSGSSPSTTAASEKEGSALPPIMSLITALTSPSSNVPKDLTPNNPATVNLADPPPSNPPGEPMVKSQLDVTRHESTCKSLSAVLTLITAFRTLAFSPPHSLSSSSVSRAARAPASHQCIHVFRDLLSLLSPETLTPLSEDDPQWHEREANTYRAGKESPAGIGAARCSHARMAILQWLVRLRADRDHRLFVVKDLDRQLEPFATLLGRSGALPSGTHDESSGRPTAPPNTRGEDRERELQRNRSVTRRSLGGALDLNVATARPGRELDRTRAPSRGRRDTSRGGSQPPTSPPLEVSREPLWGVPEALPFDVPIGTRPSEGMTTYEAGMSNADDMTTSLWLPVSTYVSLLIDIINDERDWEILSYTLCHMPLQLSNKHLFCGPLTSKVITKLVACLSNLILQGRLGSKTELPKGVKSTDVQSVAYHSLTVLISYRKLLSRQVLDGMMEAFQQGLTRYHGTVKPCLHALAISAFELQPQMTRCLSRILNQLSQIVTNPNVSVYILELLITMGSIPALYANFTEEDYRRVFTVSLKYIQHHNLPESASAAQSSQSLHALSQHVLAIAYYNIYVWFLAVKLPDRPKYIPHISRNLLIASSHKSESEVDEPSEVCFDWLARYTYADADPKPSRSFLGEVIGEGTPVNSKTWLQGNSLVTIRSSKKPGWIEMESRRPSGMTRFLCRLENVATLGLPVEHLDSSSGSGLETPRVSASLPLLPDPDRTPIASSAAVNQVAVSEGISMQSDLLPTATSQPPQSTSVTGSIWRGPEPARRPTDVTIDPSFMALQMSPYPDVRRTSARSRLVPNSEELKRLVRNLDRVPVIDVHAIAVLYVAPGQTDELEILANQHGSPAYTRFLHGLGRLIQLKNQREVYTGALDTSEDQDGRYAYAWWDDIAQILYHTATVMPNRPGDTQFAFKKMHIGNDSVRIVWNDSGLPYRFDTVQTQFQFINIVVEPHSVGNAGAYSNSQHEHEFFKVTCQRAPGLPEFGPIGEFKLISAENLPQFIRQASLLADFFALVYVFISKDTTRREYVTNWRHRLLTIKRFRETLPAVPPEDNDISRRGLMAQEEARDFTRIY